MAFEDGRPSLPFAFHADAETLARDNTILISGVVYRRSLHDELGPSTRPFPSIGTGTGIFASRARAMS